MLGADWGEPSIVDGGENNRIEESNRDTLLSSSPQPKIVGGTQRKLTQMFPKISKIAGPPSPSLDTIGHQGPPTTSGGHKDVKSDCLFKRGICQRHNRQGNKKVEKSKRWGQLKDSTYGWIHTSKVVWTCNTLELPPNSGTGSETVQINDATVHRISPGKGIKHLAGVIVKRLADQGGGLEENG